MKSERRQEPEAERAGRKGIEGQQVGAGEEMGRGRQGQEHGDRNRKDESTETEPKGAKGRDTSEGKQRRDESTEKAGTKGTRARRRNPQQIEGIQKPKAGIGRQEPRARRRD